LSGQFLRGKEIGRAVVLDYPAQCAIRRTVEHPGFAACLRGKDTPSASSIRFNNGHVSTAIYELPMKFSKTPAYIGGPTNRGAPCYGEDNMWVLTELLGRSPSEVERLADEGVI
jgi:hypothetical protein